MNGDRKLRSGSYAIATPEKVVRQDVKMLVHHHSISGKKKHKSLHREDKELQEQL